MKKLTLAVVRRKDGERRFVLSNFTSERDRSGLLRPLAGSREAGLGNCQICRFKKSQRRLLSKSGLINKSDHVDVVRS